MKKLIAGGAGLILLAAAGFGFYTMTDSASSDNPNPTPPPGANTEPYDCGGFTETVPLDGSSPPEVEYFDCD
jgi:hypothetical protein